MTFTPFTQLNYSQIPGTELGICQGTPSFNSIPRNQISGSVSALASGVASIETVEVPAGYNVTRLGFMAGGTAAVTPAHWWLALINPATLTVLGATPDQGAAAIAAFSINDLFMSAPAVAPGNSAYLTQLWVALMVSAATVPTCEGNALTGIATTPPIVAGVYGAALTTPPAVGSTVATPTSPSARFLCWAH
jgi:hypothetical protein